ncbi:uncharacterized protein GGS22DRAFT_150105 [Annulohypoxylon maeteangense]|uniref:uncharacterized protein n=1 Tax=Annulohypoxylon maeteangense TaxID=1927788 RepID=UPI002007365C|nr:uncharacterized protein GGS22DRAFT_150105 [Annulohypoxylon maeteangense]KAI0890153.1 hypothetical protein GGS22DRAFT_150105 [Annulohypoxylon maeteangense]
MFNSFIMSSNKSYSYSSSSVSFSSSTTRDGKTTGSRFAEHTTSDPSGTTTHFASQRSGEPLHHERREYDSSGRLTSSEGRALGGSGVDTRRRIEDVSDEQRENDKLYEERIEDEYAKREGGA